MRLLGYL
jgi:predicted nucleic acid-binding protein